MRHIAFVELLAQLKQLTPEQRKRRVLQLLGRESAPVSCSAVLLPAPTGCPHCSAAVERLGGHGAKVTASSATPAAAGTVAEPSTP